MQTEHRRVGVAIGLPQSKYDGCRGRNIVGPEKRTGTWIKTHTEELNIRDWNMRKEREG